MTEKNRRLEPAPRIDEVYIQGANNMDKPDKRLLTYTEKQLHRFCIIDNEGGHSEWNVVGLLKAQDKKTLEIAESLIRQDEREKIVEETEKQGIIDDYGPVKRWQELKLRWGIEQQPKKEE